MYPHTFLNYMLTSTKLGLAALTLASIRSSKLVWRGIKTHIYNPPPGRHHFGRMIQPTRTGPCRINFRKFEVKVRLELKIGRQWTTIFRAISNFPPVLLLLLLVQSVGGWQQTTKPTLATYWTEIATASQKSQESASNCMAAAAFTLFYSLYVSTRLSFPLSFQ